MSVLELHNSQNCTIPTKPTRRPDTGYGKGQAWQSRDNPDITNDHQLPLLQRVSFSVILLLLDWSTLGSCHHATGLWTLLRGQRKNPSLTLRFASVPQESHRVIWLVMLRSHRTRGGKEYLNFPHFQLEQWLCSYLSFDFHTHRYGSGSSWKSSTPKKQLSKRELIWCEERNDSGSADSCS